MGIIGCCLESLIKVETRERRISLCRTLQIYVLRIHLHVQVRALTAALECTRGHIPRRTVVSFRIVPKFCLPHIRPLFTFAGDSLMVRVPVCHFHLRMSTLSCQLTIPALNHIGTEMILSRGEDEILQSAEVFSMILITCPLCTLRSPLSPLE